MTTYAATFADIVDHIVDCAKRIRETRNLKHNRFELDNLESFVADLRDVFDRTEAAETPAKE